MVQLAAAHYRGWYRRDCARPVHAAPSERDVSIQTLLELQKAPNLVSPSPEYFAARQKFSSRLAVPQRNLRSGGYRLLCQRGLFG